MKDLPASIADFKIREAISILTTFKRDFKKAFHTTPQKWLTPKRLELAHYHFVEKNKKPVDVCYEVGFEN